jgi:sialate O-acetylesterase
MEWTVMNARDSEDVIRHSGDPMLRLFTVPKLASPTPVEDVPPGWKECGPDAVIGFSAVAYFFGRDLRKSLGVPVGLIHTSWGGTPAEAWTRRGVLEGNPELKGMVDGYDQAVKGYFAALPSYADALAKYHDDVAKAAKEPKEVPPPPGPPQFHAVQRHDRPALALRHQGGHLVPGRVERRPGLPVPHPVPGDDSELARRLEAG